jgi:hypothetical protein
VSSISSRTVIALDEGEKERYKNRKILNPKIGITGE